MQFAQAIRDSGPYQSKELGALAQKVTTETLAVKESFEGMAGDQEGLDKGDSHRLGEVVRAKEKIGAKPKHKPSQ